MLGIELVKAERIRVVALDELADQTTAAAAGAATDLLLRCFKEVEQELKTVLKDLDDPLRNAADPGLNRR